MGTSQDSGNSATTERTATTGTTGTITTRRRNPRGHGERLREELLAAAEALVTAQHGVGQLSLRSVAKEVGVAATSVYLHFPDLDHLKWALVDRGFERLNAARTEAIAGLGEPATVLIARWRAYATFAMANPGLYRLMFGPDLPPAQAFDEPTSPGRAAFLAGVEAITEGRRTGVVTAPGDPFHLAALTWSAIHGLVILRVDRPTFPWPPLDEMIDETLHRILMMPAVDDGPGRV